MCVNEEGKMRVFTKVKKVVITFMLVVVVCGVLSKSASAYTPEPVYRKDLNFDEDKYDVQWFETQIVKVYQTEKTRDSDFNVGQYLGYVEIFFGFATEIDNDDEYIDQRLVFKAKMHPRYVTDEKQSLPYTLGVEVLRNDGIAMEMVCAGSSVNEMLEEERLISYIVNSDNHGCFCWDYFYDKENDKKIDQYWYKTNELYGIAKWVIGLDTDYEDWKFDVKVTASYTGGKEEEHYIILDDGYPKELGEAIGYTVLELK